VDDPVTCAPEVRDALAAGRAVVALESTIFSRLGLPHPVGAEALAACAGAIRAAGAVPAVVAVLDGRVRVGIDPDDHPRILAAGRKVAERDIAVAVGEGWETGATTVSATLAACVRAGVRVFATGGIGGVHRGASEHGDVSADLPALARHPVLVVSAGAKVFLDLPRTLEMLETLGVPVLGHRCDRFPAFYLRSSGLPVQHRVDGPEAAARVARAHWAMGRGGLLLANPIPAGAEPSGLAAALDHALAEADRAGVRGPAVTPFVLDRIAEASAGASLAANVALARSNAEVAAQVALAL
jgi:pseudouridine-5'-phosphate glycosidase